MFIKNFDIIDKLSRISEKLKIKVIPIFKYNNNIYFILLKI